MTDQPTTPPTSQQLTPAEIRLGQYGERTSTWSTATYNDGTEKALHEIALGLKAEVDRLRAELAKEERRHGDTIDDRDRAQDAADKLAYAVAPEDVIGEHTADNSPWQNALELITSAAETNRLRAELHAEKSAHQFTLRQRNNRSRRLNHLRDMALTGDVEGLLIAAKDTLAASVADHVECGPTAEDLAAADNPTRLRWGLNDVLWGDDDTVIVLLSGPDREPYWLELEADRAAVLREDLAGPPAEETHEPAPLVPNRTLTPGEYSAAWHAVEGAAGEEGADPGTVLHAVLDRLGIGWQDAARPAAAPVVSVTGEGTA